MQQRGAARKLGVIVMLLGALTLSGCAAGEGPVEDYAGVPLIEVFAVGEGEGEGPVAEDDGEQAEEGEEESESITLEELEVEEGEATAVYLEDGGQIAIVLWGSSTCPPVGSRLIVLEDAESGNAIRVDLAEIPADRPCTQDFVAHTTVFRTPQDVTTTQPLRIDVGGEQIELPIK